MKEVLEYWRSILTAVAFLVGSWWAVVTWANDKIEKIEKVPTLEEAVLLLQREQANAKLREETLRQAEDARTKLIIERLDALIVQGR